MSRRVVWLQLLIGWLPVWALFAVLIVTAHPHTSHISAMHISFRMIVAAAALGLVVQRLTERLPWPTQVRLPFVALHVVAAITYALVWLVLNSLIESVFRGTVVIVVGYSLSSFLIAGVWIYVMVAGVSYAIQASERVARAEATAARSHLAALRAQLNPHFLFNALHTVVQLIPREPRRAAQAAEQLAGLLRGTIEENRDLVPVAEELAFVERYLDLERIRFGDRLRVHVDVSDAARQSLVPSFAVQTLVENAVRHGAAPRVDATDVTISGHTTNGTLTLTVRDTGVGAAVDGLIEAQGSGLRRLRARLGVLYGIDARLDLASEATGGFSATLVIPRTRDAE